MFVSSTPFDFDLTSDGIVSGDEHCQTLADAAGLPGEYLAWLSVINTDAVDRLELLDARGWRRMDGRAVIDSVMDIRDGAGLYYPVRFDENGNEIDVRVWTGTRATGVGVPGPANTNRDCAGWRSPTSGLQGTVGSALGAHAIWSDAETQACDGTGHLYCMGTDLHVDTRPAAPPVNAGLAFVSSTVPLDEGIAALDERCQTDADAAGMEGDFLALIPTTQVTAAERFEGHAGPWVLRNDAVVFEDHAALQAGEPLTTIHLRADGSTAGSAVVVVGSEANDALATVATSCSNWTTTSSTMTSESLFFGLSASEQRSQGGCAGSRPVYCLQL